jgi:dTDP-4-amino-4,6-dideoxy-D-galactose acyltransferase
MRPSIMPEPIEPLAWDSKFFHRRVGKLILNTATSLDELLHSASQERYELLYIYSHIQIEDRLIGRYALLDVGGHITFAKNLSSECLTKARPTQEICELQLDTLTPELLEIAFLSGHLSRFKIDLSLPAGSFERLYETWLTNTLENRPRTSIYTYYSDDRVVGLITSELHEPKCNIGLLAVSQSHQGQGIATKLIRHVQDICTINKVASIEVKSQLSNKCAIGLYLKNSFAESDRSFLYHAHNVE